MYVGINDDYVCLEAGGLEFYFGYEYTVPADAHEKELEEYEWAFVVHHNNKEICRWAASEVTPDDKLDIVETFLIGVAKFIDKQVFMI